MFPDVIDNFGQWNKIVDKSSEQDITEILQKKGIDQYIVDREEG